MMDKVEMSLDDIIKQGNSRTGGGRRGRGTSRGTFQRRGAGRGNSRGGSFNGGGGGAIRNRKSFSSPRSPYSRSPGDINSKWQHDMYDGAPFNKRAGGIVRGGGGLVSGSGGPTKLLISNLDFGVSNSDIQELFIEFGDLRSATVHYDKSGRSLGTAEVVFERKSDGIKAYKQYNGVPLDGRPMNILFATSSAPPRPQVGRTNFNQRNQMRNTRGGGGRGVRRGGGGRGGRGGRFGGGPKPTAEELDAELDAYVNKLNSK